MKEPITIPKYEEIDESLDYSFLMQKGIESAQQLSGDIWTDFNDHDPGVTILEQLTYALTELAYKANLSIEDIFHNTKDEKFDNKNYALFTANEVFPFTPLTPNDYRQFIIDHIPAIQNAWIIPKEQSKLGFNVVGIYEVLLQIEDESKKEEITNEVKQLLAAHRNLCEDFDEIKVLTSKKVTIKADINVKSDVVGESLLANIAFTLSEILTPSVRLHSMEEILEKGASPTEVFKRAIPKHGFIAQEDLINSDITRIGTIHKSELIKNIADLEGVQGVENFEIKIEGKVYSGEVIQFSELFEEEFIEGKYLYPLLDTKSIFKDEGSIKLLIANDFEYIMNYSVAKYTFDIAVEQNKAGYHAALKFPKLTLENTVDNKEISFFHSIQNTFPENYGVGEYGLSQKATPHRRGVAKQLKGYLLLFEQVMLNYLSQLANAYKLFSIKKPLKQTYFYQIPTEESIPNIQELIDTSKQGLIKELEKINKEFDPVNKRQNKFLDHLLSRFGEEFMHESFNIINQTSSWQNEIEFQEDMTVAKLKFLSDYINISESRGKGFNYLERAEDISNVSGLKKRITYLFNLNDNVEGNLSDIVENEGVEVKKINEGEKELGQKNEFVFDSKDASIQEAILKHGVHGNNYHIDKATFKIYFTNPTSRDTCLIYQGDSLVECEESLVALIDYLKELNEEADNFYIVEHILLRPIDNRRYCYYFVSDNRRLLRSTYLYEEEKDWFIEQIIAYGKKTENYEIRETNEEFTVYLKNSEGKVIALVDEFISQESAEAGRDKAKLHVQFHTNQGRDIKDQIYTEEQTKAGAALGLDPYSMAASIVLPAWTSRFQYQELRQLLEQMIHENAPAHLNLNFFWLSPIEMAVFERYYKVWRNVKATLKPVQPLLDNLSFNLQLLLSVFKTLKNQEAIEQEAMEMFKKNQEFEKALEKLLTSFEEDTTIEKEVESLEKLLEEYN